MKNDNLVDAIVKNWASAALSPKRVAMLTFAVKLTETPAKIDRTDIGSLREADFSDRDILDIVEVVAYYAFANRIADGLGIEVEPQISD